MDKALIKQLLDLRGVYDSVAIATIAVTRGSTPRKAGAKMIVAPDGSCFGTVGGGCTEADVRREALEVIRTGRPTLYHLALQADFNAEEGMVCGGSMEVFIEPVDLSTAHE